MLHTKLINFLCGLPIEQVTLATWESIDSFEKQYISKQDGTLITEFQFKGLIQTTWEEFGGTIDDNGRYLIMNPIKPYILDAVYSETIDEIIRRLHEKGLSERNIRLQ
jgi:hypothetical protein